MTPKFTYDWPKGEDRRILLYIRWSEIREWDKDRWEIGWWKGSTSSYQHGNVENINRFVDGWCELPEKPEFETKIIE